MRNDVPTLMIASNEQTPPASNSKNLKASEDNHQRRETSYHQLMSENKATFGVVTSSPDKKQRGNEVRVEQIRVAVRVRPQLKLEIAKELVCFVGKSVRNYLKVLV